MSTGHPPDRLSAMTVRDAVIRNAMGIHCRPSAEIIKVAGPYPGTATVETATASADCRSIMGLLSLGLETGTPVRVRVEGPDEEAMCEKLAALFEKHFDFPPRK